MVGNFLEHCNRPKSLLFLFAACSLLTASPLAAAQPIRLANDPTLSPDGSTLTFSWRGKLWSVPSTGGTVRRLTLHQAADRYPRYSPDGGQIAFSRETPQGSQLLVMPAQGGTPRQLTFHSAGYTMADWFPDGQSIMAQSRRDHFWRHNERYFRVTVNARSAEKLLFDDYAAEAVLSPDGKRILFTREGVSWTRKGYRGSQAAQIWLLQLETGEFKKVLDDPRGCQAPLWKPDGNGFYYTSGRNGSVNLWEYDLNGGATKQLTNLEDDSVVFPCISRSGNVLVFRHLFDFYRFDPHAAGPPQRLELLYDGDELPEPVQRVTLQDATDFAVSKDGLELAFVAGGDIWVMDTELREPRQVTFTAAEERDPVFAPDGDAIWYVSDRDGQTDLWRAKRADATKYWWQNEKFNEDRITNDAETESQLKWSPAGQRVAYLRGRGDLWSVDAEGKDPKQHLASWDAPQFQWAPDGSMFVYAAFDQDFNRDVWIVPVDGSKPALNISRHPDNEADPVWSPDGKLIAFTSRRVGDETDICYVWLRSQDDQQTSRERTLQKAVEKLDRARRPKGKRAAEGSATGANPGENPGENPGGEADGAVAGAEADAADEPKPAGTERPGAKAPVKVTYDFDEARIADRIHRISIPNTAENELLWSPDSKRLAFIASVNGTRGLYAVEIPEALAPKPLTTETGARSIWLSEGNQIVWISNGTLTSFAVSGKLTAYRFSAQQAVDRAERQKAIFDQCWQTMRDRFYDERLGNRNWDAVRRKYRDVAGEMVDLEGVATLVSMMLGELNGSHMGFTLQPATPVGAAPPAPPGAPTPTPTPSPRSRGASGSWTESTAHLGLRFVADHKGPGLLVRDIIPDGPTDLVSTKVEAGEVLLAIDNKPVDPDLDLTTVLNGPEQRDIRLKIRGKNGQEREITIRPISYSTAVSNLYDKWLLDNRKHVEQASQGKLSYLHIRGMNEVSFHKFEEELYSAGVGKSGLIIDVRENGGGSTADHLLTALTQPTHAITVPRGGQPGYPQDRKIYATWNKPIVVLCNQNSFSNAEIFSHAVKTLGRGKLVGVPTAGGVISTGAKSIMGVGTIRLPTRGWFLMNDGQDMELNGAVPQHLIWPEPGQLPQGKDLQLDKAIEVLLADVQAFEQRPQPALKKASERPGEK